MMQTCLQLMLPLFPTLSCLCCWLCGEFALNEKNIYIFLNDVEIMIEDTIIGLLWKTPSLISTCGTSSSPMLLWSGRWRETWTKITMPTLLVELASSLVREKSLTFFPLNWSSMAQPSHIYCHNTQIKKNSSKINNSISSHSCTAGGFMCTVRRPDYSGGLETLQTSTLRRRQSWSHGSEGNFKEGQKNISLGFFNQTSVLGLTMRSAANQIFKQSYTLKPIADISNIL